MREIARSLYDSTVLADHQAAISLFAENSGFQSAELFVIPDHYVFRGADQPGVAMTSGQPALTVKRKPITRSGSAC